MTAPAKFLASRDSRSRQLRALFCLLLFIGLQVLASSPALHRWIHTNADNPDHQCAVTCLTHGGVAATGTAIILTAFVATVIFWIPSLSTADFPSVYFRLLPSRGPPASVSSF